MNYLAIWTILHDNSSDIGLIFLLLICFLTMDNEVFKKSEISDFLRYEVSIYLNLVCQSTCSIHIVSICIVSIEHMYSVAKTRLENNTNAMVCLRMRSAYKKTRIFSFFFFAKNDFQYLFIVKRILRTTIDLKHLDSVGQNT